MASTSGCAMDDEVDLVENLSPVIGVGDEEDNLSELVEWPRLKGSRVEYPKGSSRFRDISHGGDCLYLLPDLAKEKKCRHLGDEVSLEYVQGVVKDSQTDGYCCYLAQFDSGLTLSLCNFAKGVMNMIGTCPAQLNCNFWEVILVCKTLNERWAASGSERRITAKDFWEYYAVKYVTATDGAYLSSCSSRPCFFDLSSAGQVWNDNPLWVSGECHHWSDEEPLELNNRTITKGICCKVSRKESFIDVVAREGTELEADLKELEISRFKRVASKDDKVVLEESDKIAEGTDLRPRIEAETGLLEKQCYVNARKMMVSIVDDEFKKDRSIELEKRNSQLKEEKNQFEENLTREREDFQLELEKEREAVALKQKEVRAESVAEQPCREALPAKEVEEMEDGLNVAEKTAADNQETINQLKEAKSQVEDMTSTILSRDLALNQLTSEFAELKEKALPGSRYEAELAKYRIKALNDEISDMRCNIRALNKQLLKKVIDLDTVRTNLAVSEADLKKLNNSIAGKDFELRNSAQMRDSLIARNVRRAVQRDKEMNERINQLCARISELERELRVRELKYEKDLKFELDKWDGEIASGEGSREMKDFLRRKEELVENMRIDLTNSWQKSIDHTWQMTERIDQLTAEQAESKARRLRDNKRALVTHQSFKVLVVHEQEKCDGKALYQRQLSALAAFFIEEIKLLQVEKDLMQDCFSGRTCVCKLDISSIDPIGVMDCGIRTTTAEQIARGGEIVTERTPEYMASKTKIGGSSSEVSPTPAVGGRSTALPSRKSSIIKKK
ncbi:hypothetical protein GIB67_042099 [Kingdonia uniflora]|uniref:Uncharacterized protein n=1 Tax=Kingdonia uniflora TaxID=39325 RepID=A0A7J7MWE6_9MAGN|nr:hypothetical protein GIB67_042099 [Kingdonia uniflora]